ncbi:MAG: class I SAM-dependent methyltransferase [Gaiellaceae bacterium]
MHEAGDYSLGDSDIAAERLALVARIFDPTTCAFLQRLAPRQPRLALDLGCGPGHTTELVAEIVEPERIVGLDSSESFLAHAHGRVDSRIELVCHDVRSVPFPARPADLIFARLLLSHLPEPEEQVARWVGELAPGGVLLSDEVERIESRLEQFARYLALTERRIAASGGELYLGPRLDALREGAGFRQRSSDLVRVAPPTGEVAAMFRLNLRAMRADGRLEGFAGPGELDVIGRALDELARSKAEGEIVWYLRQTVFSPA